MTCLMNRLQLTATCQVLPDNLRSYLKTMTKIKKEDRLAHMKQMEEVDFDDSQNQRNFIFESSQQSGNKAPDKAQIMQELLEKYNNLPERCKSRAKPVKDYIEKHLNLAKTMKEGGGDSEETNEIKTIQTRSDKKLDEALIQEQLESLGLGKEHRFTPKFDLNEMIESKRREKEGVQVNPLLNANVIKRDLKSISRSKQYNKLLDAVRKVKLKKDGERHIAEAFGRPSDYSGFSFNSRSDEAKDVAKASFESPLVYSL